MAALQRFGCLPAGECRRARGNARTGRCRSRAPISGAGTMVAVNERESGAAVVTRLSASDSSFYRLEDTSTPMYVGSLSILRCPKGGLPYESLLTTVERRLPQISRYRQKVREVTLGLARPVWIDDRDFDITYHI